MNKPALEQKRRLQNIAAHIAVHLNTAGVSGDSPSPVAVIVGAFTIAAHTRFLSFQLCRHFCLDGCRTPFAKSFGKLMHCTSIALGVSAVKGLIEKTKVVNIT